MLYQLSQRKCSWFHIKTLSLVNINQSVSEVQHSKEHHYYLYVG